MTRIEEIKGRCDKATPGPWEFVGDHPRNNYECGSYNHLSSNFDTIILLEDAYPGYPECGEDLRMNLNGEDAEFIAHSREDIPYLLDINADLLEACEAILDQEDRRDGCDYLIHQVTFEKVRAAIQKAKAE